MLGRRLLKRLTRLGLATYAMTWCMAFTVCASENPIADLAVANAVETLAYEESAARERLLPDPKDAVTASDVLSAENDAVIEDSGESLNPEVLSEEDAPVLTDDAGVEAIGNDGVVYDHSSPVSGISISAPVVSIFNISKSYRFYVDPINSSQTLNMSKVTYYISESADGSDPDSDYRGATIYNNGTLTFSDSTESMTFYVVGKYDNGEGQTLNATRKVVVYIPVNELSADCGDVMDTAHGIGSNHNNLNLTINKTSENTWFKVMLNDADTLDNDRLSWGLYENSNPVAKERGINLYHGSMFINSSIDDKSVAFINFTNLNSSGTFDVVAKYDNNFVGADGESISLPPTVLQCSVRINVDGNTSESDYCYDVKEVGFLGTSSDIEVESGCNMTFELYSVDPTGVNLDPNKISWGLTLKDNDQYKEFEGVELKPDGTQCLVAFKDVKQPQYLDVAAKYFNNETVDAPGAEYVIARCHAFVNVSMPGGDYEAHLDDKALKVELYKSQNTLPVAIRTLNYSQTIGDYNIINVEFINPSLSSLFNVGVLEDGKTININTSKSLVSSLINGGESSFMKEFKKGVTTGLQVWAEVDGKTLPKPLISDKNITITFGNMKPTAKDVKAVGPLEFNSYNAGQEGKPVQFTGANVGRIGMPTTEKEVKALKTAGLCVNESSGTVNTMTNIKAKGSGKINVLAFINDTAFNLPYNYNVSVPVSYKIVNDAPILLPDRTTVTFNTNINETLEIICKVNGYTDDTVFVYEVLDSKGKPVSPQPVNVNLTKYFPEWDVFYVTLGLSKDAKPGSGYKVRLYAENTNNGQKSAYEDLTVKTVKENSKLDFTLKAEKGGIDAGVPGSYLNLIRTGKNVNLEYRKPVITFALKNGTDVTKYFDTMCVTGNANIFILENKTFSLLEAGLGGKQVIANISFDIDGQKLSKLYSFKVGQSTVIPKLETTKASINPAFINQTIAVPIINLPPGIYNYSVEFDCGKGISAPFDGYVKAGADTDVLYIVPIKAGLKSVEGKTCTVKLTPKLPSGINASLDAKPAAFKVSVLTEKKAAAMTAKTKGSIDAVRDDTGVTAEVSFKNVYAPEAILININCTSVTQKGKTFDGIFNVTTDGNIVTFNRMPGKDIAAGTYDAVLTAEFAGYSQTVSATVKIKVVRGKTNTVANPSQIVLINRDNARATKVYLNPKSNDVNNITGVEIVADKNKYNEIFNLTETTTKGEYVLRVRKGYYEEEKAKQGKLSVLIPISKSVKKSVKANVYYNGSTEPDVVTLNVRIDP